MSSLVIFERNGVTAEWNKGADYTVRHDGSTIRCTTRESALTIASVIAGTMNTGGILRADADGAGVPLRTLADVQTTLAEAERQGSAVSFRRLLLKHGRLTAEARAWLQANGTL